MLIGGRGNGTFQGGTASSVFPGGAGEDTVSFATGRSFTGRRCGSEHIRPAGDHRGEGRHVHFERHGDGKADILWQNTNGQAAAWTMSGTTILSQTNLVSNPGTIWHVVANTSGI